MNFSIHYIFDKTQRNVRLRLSYLLSTHSCSLCTLDLVFGGASVLPRGFRPSRAVPVGVQGSTFIGWLQLRRLLYHVLVILDYLGELYDLLAEGYSEFNL